MVTNLKLLIAMAFAYTLTVSGSCNKSIFGCTESSYSFILIAKVFPDKDTINTGDTVWVEVDSPTEFIDQNSNQQVNFSGANNLGTNMGFVKLTNISPIELSYAVNDFSYVLISGKEASSANPLLIKDYLLSEIDQRYKFKVGIIPKLPGTYRFNLGNPVYVYRNGKSCPKADFNMQLVQTNQHYYLYPGGSGVTPAGADYFFYVR